MISNLILNSIYLLVQTAFQFIPVVATTLILKILYFQENLPYILFPLILLGALFFETNLLIFLRGQIGVSKSIISTNEFDRCKKFSDGIVASLFFIISILFYKIALFPIFLIFSVSLFYFFFRTGSISNYSHILRRLFLPFSNLIYPISIIGSALIFGVAIRELPFVIVSVLIYRKGCQIWNRLLCHAFFDVSGGISLTPSHYKRDIWLPHIDSTEKIVFASDLLFGVQSLSIRGSHSACQTKIFFHRNFERSIRQFSLDAGDFSFNRVRAKILHSDHDDFRRVNLEPITYFETDHSFFEDLFLNGIQHVEHDPCTDFGERKQFVQLLKKRFEIAKICVDNRQITVEPDLSAFMELLSVELKFLEGSDIIITPLKSTEVLCWYCPENVNSVCGVCLRVGLGLAASGLSLSECLKTLDLEKGLSGYSGEDLRRIVLLRCISEICSFPMTVDLSRVFAFAKQLIPRQLWR